MPKLTNTSLTGLDFDEIRESLRDYLAGQDEFQDYDFEGSSMSVLLNALAYNTHYIAYYLNMVANEMFLDSAITRRSVVSSAKSLGYTPQSARAATAQLNLSLTPNAESRATLIPKYTPFTFTQSNTTYKFLVADDTPIDTATNTATVIVKEGTARSFTYVYDSTNVRQRFIIPQENVDTSTIRVSVFDSPESTERTEYTLVSDASSLTKDSLVYFISENPSGKYEIYFGDNTIGKAPTNGSQVYIEYIATNGAAANGAGSKETTVPLFTLGSSLAGYSSVTARVADSATGGGAKQSIDQIRFLAPLFYESQNRAVTIRDYEAIIKNTYPTTEAVMIYGGEDALPPEYGKVFIAIKPTVGETTSNRVKQEIANLIKDKNIVTVAIDVVDPEILYCKIDSAVYYDSRVTAKSSGTILDEVVTGIRNFGDNTLEKFNRSLLYSKFTTYIDEIDKAIVHNVTDVSVYKRLIPSLNLTASYSIKFNNALHHPNDGYSEPVVTSDPFLHLDTISNSVVTAYLEDDGSGTIRMYRLVNGKKTVVNPNIGTVDYKAGTVSLVDFTPISIVSGKEYIQVYADFENEDVISSRNTILSILPEDIKVEIKIREDDLNKPLAGY